MRFFFLLLVSCSSLLATPWRVNLGAGGFDVHGNSSQALVQAEWRYPWEKRKFKFFSSTFITSEASFYFCTGFCFDLAFCHRLVIVPSFAPGVYFQGRGKDLGFPLEFRTGLELGWQTDKGYRVTGQYYHISNATIGKINPGAESFVFNVSFSI